MDYKTDLVAFIIVLIALVLASKFMIDALIEEIKEKEDETKRGSTDSKYTKEE